VDRERRVSEVFVTLADILVADFDVVELLERLVLSCVELIDVTAAALILTDPRGGVQVMAYSSENCRALEQFQLDAEQGPGLDCLRARTPVSAGELAGEAGRWPRFALRARASGFQSAYARPMRLRDQTIGALDLFSSHLRLLPDADLLLAQALADVATIGVLSQRAARRQEALAEQLQRALGSRIVIEQAKGILAEAGQIDPEAAFIRLRDYARRRNLRLSGLARDLVVGQLAPEQVFADWRSEHSRG
jgi:hypothetical protein